MSNTEKSYELTALEKSNVVKFKVTTSKKYHALTEVDTTCIYFLVDTREITVTTNSRKYTKNVFLTIRLSDVSLIYYISSVRIL